MKREGWEETNEDGGLRLVKVKYILLRSFSLFTLYSWRLENEEEEDVEWGEEMMMLC